MTTAMRFVFVAFALFGPVSVRADIGETEQELVRRFGPPTQVVEGKGQTGPFEKILHFTKATPSVSVALINGKSAYEEHHLDKAIEGPGDPKVLAVLDRQSHGEKWELFPNPKLLGEDRMCIWNRKGTAQEEGVFAQVRTTSPNCLVLQTDEATRLLAK